VFPVSKVTSQALRQMYSVAKYACRGWDWQTGKPTKEKLMELGLTQAAEDLYPNPDKPELKIED